MSSLGNSFASENTSEQTTPSEERPFSARKHYARWYSDPSHPRGRLVPAQAASFAGAFPASFYNRTASLSFDFYPLRPDHESYSSLSNGPGFRDGEFVEILDLESYVEWPKKGPRDRRQVDFKIACLTDHVHTQVTDHFREGIGIELKFDNKEQNGWLNNQLINICNIQQLIEFLKDQEASLVLKNIRAL